MQRRLLFGSTCAFALLAAGQALAATTSFVAPVQTYACASHQWANSLAGSTAATTCTQPAFSDISSVLATSQLPTITAGTVIANPSTSSAQAAASSSPILGAATVATGTLGFSGTTSGTVTVQPQAAAGTYNFNLPTTAGTAGQVLTSQGGSGVAMTWTTVATNACTLTANPASPVTLTSANDGVCYATTNATAVTFNLTASLAAGDNWCFFQESTGAITVSDNSVTSAQIFMANVGGTVTTGTLVSQAAGSVACLTVVVGGANPIVLTKNSEGYWQLT